MPAGQGHELVVSDGHRSEAAGRRGRPRPSVPVTSAARYSPTLARWHAVRHGMCTAPPATGAVVAARDRTGTDPPEQRSLCSQPPSSGVRVDPVPRGLDSLPRTPDPAARAASVHHDGVDLGWRAWGRRGGGGQGHPAATILAPARASGACSGGGEGREARWKAVEAPATITKCLTFKRLLVCPSISALTTH